MTTCQGCGAYMGDYRVIYTDDYSEYCGACNQRYCEQRELEEAINRKISDDRFEEMVKKYGYENACEILADEM